MRPTGIVDLPLHGGRCPRWLFPLMKELSGKISETIINEHGEDELLKRLSDPYWFQALGCVIGFDWHSSGLTTTTCGALKEAFRNLNIGVEAAGGKGKTSRKAISEIESGGDRLGAGERKIKEMVRASRLGAKVDNSLVQDGYNLYHHSFFFNKRNWTIVQQGMSRVGKNYARRYHWISSKVEKFVQEPHSGIISSKTEDEVLNLTSRECENAQKISVDLVNDNPEHLKKYLNCVDKKGQTKLFSFYNKNSAQSFVMGREHFPQISADMKILLKAYDEKPKNYEDLLCVKGMGAKNLRALAMVSHLVYGSKLSWKDPCKFSWAHGGKDGWPYPVNREVFKESIAFLDSALLEARVDKREKLKAMRRLDSYYRSVINR